MLIDIVYLSWNRLEFMKKSWGALMENTDWGLVRAVYVYDDGSEQHTQRWLQGQMGTPPVLTNYIETPDLRSPVRTMNEYVDQTIADAFVKIDSDIVMPPHWLNIMVDVMERHDELELLGAEASMSETPPKSADPDYEASYEHDYLRARHIGGVGLMRTSTFLNRPRVRPNGRYGFSEWQHQQKPVAGWVRPDLLMTDLSRLPFKPWSDYSEFYVQNGWERNWPKAEPEVSCYWDWWLNQ